jgi:hypothetical protein
MDYEKLGLFYLGRQLDPETRARRDAPVLYDASDLVTHAVIVGMTGSGKTGLGIGLIEEAAIDGVPVLAIDPKGDLPNLLLTFPNLAAAEFAPWVNPDDARTAGQDVAAYAEGEARRWAAGLAEWGQDAARIGRLRAAAEFSVYTPGSATGRPLSIVRSFAAPAAAVQSDPDLLADRVRAAATSVLTLAGVDAEPLRSREHVLVSTLFAEAWKTGRDLDLKGLIGAVQNPPLTHVGVLDLESFYPSKERFTLAMQLNQLLAAPDFAAWLQGEPIDIDHLLFTADGRPRVAILSIAHLDDHERMFFVSLLLNELVAWMRGERGTSSLRTLVYFDEIFGFLPPVANPPTKAPLLTLLKQARAFGVGLALATQNPVDLDYKALANCGTWLLGRLQTERDKSRVLDGLEGAAAASGAGFDRGELDQLLSSLSKRVFLLHNVHDKHATLFETRWTLSYLRGPMGRDELRRLARPASAAPDQQPAAPSAAAPVVPAVPAPPALHAAPPAPHAAPPAPPAPPAPSAPAPRAPTAPSAPPAPSLTPPLLPPTIRQLFAPGPGASYAPAVIGLARVTYTDAKLGLDETRDIAVVAPFTDGAVALDWEHAEPAGFGAADLSPTAPAALPFGPVPPAATQTKNYAAWEKEFGRWVARSQSVELLRSVRAKLTSAPEESERDFRVRLQTALREGRDQAVAKAREKYASKIRTAEERLRRAEAAADRESHQASESKMSAAVSLGATVLGALLGRKAASVGTLGRATTAARGMGRVSREAADVERAKQQVTELQQQLADVQAALEGDLEAVAGQWDPATDTLDRVVVKPKRGGVSVQLVALVWQPR